MPVASSQPASKGTTHFAADAGERRDDAAGLAVLHGRAAAWRGIRRTSLFGHLDASRRGTLNAFAYPTRESTFNLGPSGDVGDRRGNLETAHVEDLVIVHKVGVLDAVAAEDYAHHVRHSYPASSASVRERQACVQRLGNCAPSTSKSPSVQGLGHKSVPAFAKQLQTRVGDRRVILDTTATLDFLQRSVDS